jgi:hypothetical protein
MLPKLWGSGTWITQSPPTFKDADQLRYETDNYFGNCMLSLAVKYKLNGYLKARVGATNGCIIERRDFNGTLLSSRPWSLLLDAILTERPDPWLIALLLDLGADPNFYDPDSEDSQGEPYRSPWSYAIEMAILCGFHRANIGAWGTHFRMEAETCFTGDFNFAFLTKGMHGIIVKAMIDHGAKVDRYTVNSANETVLRTLGEWGQPRFVLSERRLRKLYSKWIFDGFDACLGKKRRRFWPWSK